MSGSSGSQSLMTGSGSKALSDVQEWSGCPPRYPRVVPGPPGCPGMVGRPCQMSESGQDFVLDVRKWSGDPP